jgi:hypothetical protein
MSPHVRPCLSVAADANPRSSPLWLFPPASLLAISRGARRTCGSSQLSLALPALAFYGAAHYHLRFLSHFYR